MQTIQLDVSDNHVNTFKTIVSNLKNNMVQSNTHLQKHHNLL